MQQPAPNMVVEHCAGNVAAGPGADAETGLDVDAGAGPGAGAEPTVVDDTGKGAGGVSVFEPDESRTSPNEAAQISSHVSCPIDSPNSPNDKVLQSVLAEYVQHAELSLEISTSVSDEGLNPLDTANAATLSTQVGKSESGGGVHVTHPLSSTPVNPWHNKAKQTTTAIIQ